MENIKVRPERINLLGIPLDVVNDEMLPDLIRSLLKDNGHHQIMFVSFKDLMKARRNKKYRKCLMNASLVIPTSKSLIRGARFLNLTEPGRYMPFNFVIKFLGALEQQRQSLYLIGSRAKPLHTISLNMRDSFPGLKIVGRCAGYYSKEMEENVVLAVKKAAPSLLLAGNGLKGKDLWLYQREEKLSPGLTLWSGECFDIIAGKKRKISQKSWEKGYYHIADILKHPWRVLRVFQHMLYGIILLFYKIRKKAA